MFETFYLKRPSKSSHSSKSSSDSIRDVDESTPSFSKPNTMLTSSQKGHSSFNRKPSSARSDTYKSREYLFGSTFDRRAKDEPEKENEKENEKEKENIYEINHNNTSTVASTNTNNSHNNYPDRFKTITINNLRRSFRESFLDSSKPAKGREHQKLWFIDVNDKGDKNTRNTESNVEKVNKSSNLQSIGADNYKNGTESRRVKRNETFRIDSDDTGNGATNSVPRRRETFRIKRDQSPVRNSQQSPSTESNTSITINSNRAPSKTPLHGKLVPIAVTAPYSASNDADYRPNSQLDRKYFNESNDSQYDTVNQEANQSEYDSYDGNYKNPSSSSTLPKYYDHKSNRKPLDLPVKTLIEIKQPENNEFLYSHTNYAGDSF